MTGSNRLSQVQIRLEVNESLAYVLNFKDDPRFKNTSAAGLIGLAEQYSKDIHGINLAERQRYYQELRQVEDILTELLGPAPGGNAGLDDESFRGHPLGLGTKAAWPIVMV